MRVSLCTVLTISLVSWQILRQDNLWVDVCGLRERRRTKFIAFAIPRTRRNENIAGNQGSWKTTLLNSKFNAVKGVAESGSRISLSRKKTKTFPRDLTLKVH